MCNDVSYDFKPRQAVIKKIRDSSRDAASGCSAELKTSGLGRFSIYNEMGNVEIEPKYNPPGARISGSASKEYVSLDSLCKEITDTLME